MADSDWVDDPPVNDDAWVDDPKPKQEHWGKSLARSTIDTVLPVAGGLGAGLLATPETLGLATIPAAAVGYAGGKQAARLLNHYLLGDEAPSGNLIEATKKTGADVLEGATAEMGGQVGAKVIGKGIEAATPYVEKVTKPAGKWLGRLAEKAAENATGATGKQATEFADDAGRQLLDRGHIKFGDSQANIANRVGKAVEDANKQIDDALTTLESKGVKVDSNKIYEVVRKKIDDLRGDPSQADIAHALEKELDNLIAATDARGSTDFGVAAAENIKRGYNRKAGNWADLEKSQVGKEMYQTYRGAVEDAAQAADPATAELFKKGKESYGLLRPIEEAAERRASTNQQSQIGDIKDMVATGVAGLPGAIARRVISPRVSSSAAVTADKVSEMLLKRPTISTLAEKNPQAFRPALTGLSSRLAERMTPAQGFQKAAEGELDRDSATPAQYPDGANNQKPGAHDISTLVKQNPQAFGKFAGILQAAEKRGPQGIASTHFILQQTNPEYRQMLERATGANRE